MCFLNMCENSIKSINKEWREYYLWTSCLLLFFHVFLFHPLPCASSKDTLGGCDTLFHCGNITAGFPFWGGNRHKSCGHPLLELNCNKNIISLNISNHEYKNFHIDQSSNTLRLARTDLLGSFCSSAFNTAILPPEIFELSSTYRSLTVLYHCDPKLSNRSSYTCPNLDLFSMSQTLDYQYSCQDSFTVNVPKNFVPEEKKLSLTHLESTLRKGFEVKLVIDGIPCRECLSSRGMCGFNSTTQVCCNVTSQSGAVSCVPQRRPSASELRRRCSERFSCANQGDLYYPFWIHGREECGHPDFKLDCSGGYAQLNIASVKYIVVYMNYHSRIIRLATLDYMGDLCPQSSLNAPFTESILPFTADTELITLYYECQLYSSAIFASRYVGELGCDSGRSYYVTRNLSSPLLDGSRGLLNNLKGICKRNVSVPVSGPALTTLQRSPNQDNLKNALTKGFELEFSEFCSRCIKSGGACGYNQTLNWSVCYCKDSLDTSSCGDSEFHFRPRIESYVIIIIIASCSLAGVTALLVLLCPCCGVRVFRKRKTSDERRQEKLKALIPLKHYTYAQVKKMTKSFEEVVGKGGFGIVYKGTLSDGRLVAVKVLKDSKGSGEDFINEVASMSQTSHVNIVSLLGFCSEGSKRAIIYEFLRNGSLDKFISDKNSIIMDLTARYGIALGVARGLEYLHYGCKTRIVHFDIKPQNVLVDDNLCPKVSDFGLAKLCEKKESIMSLMDMRGTIGYIAPEMISRVYGNVSHKSDVYSYGMLVLDMIGARNKERAHQDPASNPSSIYFPEWVYRDLELGRSRRIIENGISNEEDEIAKKMTLVGLWCIQSSPSNRPPMNRVVEMMEGSLESLQVPPRPVLQKIPAAPLSESFWISGESSSVSDVLICSTN